MSKKWITSILEDVKNASRINREKATDIVWDNPKNFKYLVEMTFDVNNKLSIKAAWVLEWICTHKSLDLILPHIDTFTENIGNVHFDSAIRPCAKICEHLATAYTSKGKNLVKNTLKMHHIEQIIETGFNWLITPQKIAVRAYTMTTLFHFGKDKDWIHPELAHLIQTKIIHESKGCKARGKFILNAIEKHKNKRL